MDEIDLLRSVLTMPEPPSETVSQGRREMQRLIRGQSRTRGQSRARPRRPGWRITGIGLTAAACAGAVTAAVVITYGSAGGTIPSAPPPAADGHHGTVTGRHPVPAPQSVQDILLTAAASAARAPARSGIYWYVRVRAAYNFPTKLQLAESWTKRDGQTWVRSLKTGRKPVELPPGNGTLGPFFLGGKDLTFRQLQRLPAHPKPLTRWIINNAAAHGGKSGGPVPSKDREREDIFDSLISLLSELPATPQLRAAAFQALAALPDVTSLGPMDGGQGVRFTLLGGQQATLIIDPATGQIIGTNYFVDNQGGEFMQDLPNATITGEWTDRLP